MNQSITNASLYVGGLDPNVSEAKLFEKFNTVGPVASIRVCRDVTTRRSLGYAYVNYHAVADAERALNTLNFEEIEGKPCRIMWTQRDPGLRKSGKGNIFVKNLDSSIDNKTLFDTFSVFGNIISSKVSASDSGESRGYGFVHFENPESAKKAIEKVNGMIIASRKVEVSPFKSRALRGGSDSGFTNVYVKNLDLEVDDEKFREIFGVFGEITSSYIAVDEETKKSKGFGFVNYANPESAEKAIKELHEKEPLNLYVSRAQKKKERVKDLSDRFQRIKLENYKKYEGTNLYIKNLDDSIDDEKLRKEFEGYGEITSAKVMVDGQGRSKGFGFVSYTDREDATKAVAEMNNKLWEGKPLYVAMAQRKEVRKQQMAQQANANIPKFNAALQNSQMFQNHPFYYSQLAMSRGPAPFMYQQPLPPQQRYNAAGPRQQGPQGQMIQNIYNAMMAGPQIGRGGMPPQMQRGRGGMMGGRGVNRGMPGATNMINPQGAAPMPANVQQMLNTQQQQQRMKFPPGAGSLAQQNLSQQQGQGQIPAGPTSVQQPVPNQTNQHVTPGNPVQQPLNSRALVNAPPNQQRQMIGEYIYPLVHQKNPQNAAKITGMLIEMDVTELIHLTENREALETKINEALAVLQRRNSQQQPPQSNGITPQ